MAKAPSKSPGTSRVRFIIVEAENSNADDLSQITQTIQNALRPTTVTRLTGYAQTSSGTAATAAQTNESVVDVEENDLGEKEVDNEDTETARSTFDASEAARRFRSPEALDPDLTTEPSSAQFVAKKNPTSDRMRYLAAAAWFELLHRNLKTITADHR